MKDKTDNKNNNITMNEDMKEYIETLLKQQQENNVNTEKHQKVAPIITEISSKAVKKITDEQIQKLESACNGDGKSYQDYLHIKNVCEHFSEITSDNEELDHTFEILNKYDYNSINAFNALALYMYHISQKYSNDAVFIDATYYVKEIIDEETGENKIQFLSSSYEVEIESLAEFMYKSRYKDILLLSKKSTEGNKTFYIYDEETKCWKTENLSYVKSIILKEIITILFNLNIKKNTITKLKNIILDSIISQHIKQQDDKEDDLLEQYTKKHPHLVQFNDIVYNIKTHQVALSHRNFMLKQVHDYNLPLGNLNKKDMKYDGETFYDLPLSIEEVRKHCQLMIERFLILFEEDQLNFIFTFFGASFYHQVKQLQAALAIRGGGGGGKSFLIEDLIGGVMFNKYVSSINQSSLERNNQFTFSSLVHKEINIIGEMKDSVMPKEMIEMLKNTQSGGSVSIEFKGQQTYKSTVYSRTIMLSNENQLPSIRTNDLNDSGLIRRIVVIDCKPKQKTNEWMNKFNEEELEEIIPHFALLCMMTFNENRKNGNIKDFHYYGGASQKVIEGFTTKSIVSTTKNYFNEHDRYRLFFNELPHTFVEKMDAQKGFNGKSEYDEYTEENFKEWLSYMKSSEVTDIFKEWHEKEYATSKGKSSINNYLKEKNVENKLKKIPGTRKNVRCYGQEFAELVVKVCLEDDADSYFQALSDNKF